PAVPPPPHSFPTRRSSDLRSTRDHTVLEPQIWKLLREQSSVPPAAHLPFDFEFPRLQKKLAAPWISCTKSEEGDFGTYPSTRRSLHNIPLDLPRHLFPQRIFARNQYSYDSITAQTACWQSGKPGCSAQSPYLDNDRSCISALLQNAP